MTPGRKLDPPVRHRPSFSDRRAPATARRRRPAARGRAVAAQHTLSWKPARSAADHRLVVGLGQRPHAPKPQSAQPPAASRAPASPARARGAAARPRPQLGRGVVPVDLVHVDLAAANVVVALDDRQRQPRPAARSARRCSARAAELGPARRTRVRPASVQLADRPDRRSGPPGCRARPRAKRSATTLVGWEQHRERRIGDRRACRRLTVLCRAWHEIDRTDPALRRAPARAGHRRRRPRRRGRAAPPGRRARGGRRDRASCAPGSSAGSTSSSAPARRGRGARRRGAVPRPAAARSSREPGRTRAHRRGDELLVPAGPARLGARALLPPRRAGRDRAPARPRLRAGRRLVHRG